MGKDVKIVKVICDAGCGCEIPGRYSDDVHTCPNCGSSMSAEE
jgi:predicted RNA-binding Zn-ribbon protein involved in translation (DUF1610 family)